MAAGAGIRINALTGTPFVFQLHVIKSMFLGAQ